MPAGTFSVAGAGADIWGTSDQFRFVYQPIDGDGEVVARVASVLNTDVWAKAGVMIREDLTANAPNAMALVSAGQGFKFQRRVTRGDQSTVDGGFGGMAPQWVRLVRSGTTISGYYSPTGTNWMLMGSCFDFDAHARLCRPRRHQPQPVDGQQRNADQCDRHGKRVSAYDDAVSRSAQDRQRWPAEAE